MARKIREITSQEKHNKWNAKRNKKNKKKHGRISSRTDNGKWQMKRWKYNQSRKNREKINGKKVKKKRGRKQCEYKKNTITLDRMSKQIILSNTAIGDQSKEKEGKRKHYGKNEKGMYFFVERTCKRVILNPSN